jgi:prephenate dehydrogenase
VKPAGQCTVGIAGLGLMGGAIAKALGRPGPDGKSRQPGAPGRLFAHDTGAETLARARAAGIIDRGFDDPGEMLPHCDVVFLCLNPSTLTGFTKTWQASFKTGALVTDIAGVKESVCAEADRLLCERNDLDFIPGHPMAGAEGEGFENSGRVNFSGKNYILTPLPRNRPENLAFLKDLIRLMGFGRVTETTAADHDNKIAFTSQLCHVIAASLIDCGDDTEITRFGGGSFEDLTRIAMLNVPMWTELFLENRDRLLSHIRQFEKSLDGIKALIKTGDLPTLTKRLAAVRDRRSGMAG